MSPSRRVTSGDADAAAVSALPAERRRPIPWSALAVVCCAWFGLWALTPGLLDHGVGSLLTANPATAISIETCVALVLAVPLLLTHRRYNRVLFARSWSSWSYALPLALAIGLPFHYNQDLPLLLYLTWTTVSVFWQDYLTFGLLQSYLRERLPTWGVLVASSAMFWLGHALFIPDRFAPVHWLASLTILALGLALASLRIRLTSMHLILVLHLSFYFIFA